MTVDELVTAAKTHLETVGSLCADIDERIKASVENLNAAKSAESKLIEEFEIKKKERRDRISVLEDEEESINAALVPLREEKTQLDTQISEKLTKIGDLKIENMRLTESNKKFRTYEERALKVLQAKESELLDREQAIEQKESLRPRAKSLLPPME